MPYLEDVLFLQANMHTTICFIANYAPADVDHVAPHPDDECKTPHVHRWWLPPECDAGDTFVRIREQAGALVFSYGLMGALLTKTKADGMPRMQTARIGALIGDVRATHFYIRKETREDAIGDYICTCSEKVVLLVLFAM